jgi:uncharacterized membrane protein
VQVREVMQPAFLFAFFALSGAALSMCAAGLALLAIGLAASRNDVANARGSDKIIALTSVCFAVPLAVFGAEHLSIPQALLALVPSYMPGGMFWVYFVGLALIAASLSIAIKREVRWSGLLFGAMMFLFVAMLHLPAAIATGDRIPWTVVVREMSFGGAGWVLAGVAMGGDRSRPGRSLILVGRSLIAIAAIFFGVQHFLHPLGLPVVPLAKQMPSWVPAPTAIDYVTGAFLLVAGVCFLLAQKTRLASAYLGGWILLLVGVVYGPVLIAALADPGTGVQVEGLNYFADTLLFGGAILSLSGADPRGSPVVRAESQVLAGRGDGLRPV